MPLGAKRISRGPPYFGYPLDPSYPPAQVRPVSNMADGEEHGELGRETARLALQLTQRFDEILLLRLKNTTERLAILRCEEARG